MSDSTVVVPWCDQCGEYISSVPWEPSEAAKILRFHRKDVHDIDARRLTWRPTRTHFEYHRPTLRELLEGKR